MRFTLIVHGRMTTAPVLANNVAILNAWWRGPMPPALSMDEWSEVVSACVSRVRRRSFGP